MVSIPLIIPEESHIVWSLVMAGNLEELQHLLLREKNLVHVRNQWGQSIMHVSYTVLLTSWLGMDHQIRLKAVDLL